ncbi:MAG: hypothetical protein ABIG93_03025 [archaeon]|nr:hypothetical protein [Nanoarchaeota archaeon]
MAVWHGFLKGNIIRSEGDIASQVRAYIHNSGNLHPRDNRLFINYSEELAHAQLLGPAETYVKNVIDVLEPKLREFDYSLMMLWSDSQGRRIAEIIGAKVGEGHWRDASVGFTLGLVVERELVPMAFDNEFTCGDGVNLWNEEKSWRRLMATNKEQYFESGPVLHVHYQSDFLID